MFLLDGMFHHTAGRLSASCGQAISHKQRTVLSAGTPGVIAGPCRWPGSWPGRWVGRTVAVKPCFGKARLRAGARRPGVGSSTGMPAEVVRIRERCILIKWDDAESGRRRIYMDSFGVRSMGWDALKFALEGDSGGDASTQQGGLFARLFLNLKMVTRTAAPR